MQRWRARLREGPDGRCLVLPGDPGDPIVGHLVAGVAQSLQTVLEVLRQKGHHHLAGRQWVVSWLRWKGENPTHPFPPILATVTGSNCGADHLSVGINDLRVQTPIGKRGGVVVKGAQHGHYVPVRRQPDWTRQSSVSARRNGPAREKHARMCGAGLTGGGWSAGRAPPKTGFGWRCSDCCRGCSLASP